MNFPNPGCLTQEQWDAYPEQAKALIWVALGQLVVEILQKEKDDENGKK